MKDNINFGCMRTRRYSCKLGVIRKTLNLSMKIKRKLILFCLGLISLLLNSSCQNSYNKSQISELNANSIEAVKDTSLWLKKTRGIRDVLEDNVGNLWFSSPDYIAKFDGKAMYYFSENDGLNIVGNLHKDANGTIWIENGFKIFRYNGNRFLEEKLDSNIVSKSLWIQRGLSPTDTIYVEPGLYEANQNTAIFHPLPVKENMGNKYLYFPTTKASLGKDGTIWIGTMEKVFGLKNNSFNSIGRKEMERQNDERQMGIRGIFVDSQGKLWIADNGAGVFVYNGNKTENFTKKYNLDKGEIEGNTLHRAFSIAEDKKGNMWFGTVYSGLWMFNPQTELFKNYTKDDGVMSENIWTIYKTKKGELLFAGESPAAVYKFNGKTFNRKY